MTHKHADSGFAARLFLGNPIASAINARTGKRMEAFGDAYAHYLKEYITGVGLGAGIGGLTGLTAGSLAGQPLSGAATGALLGSAAGGAFGGIKGTFGDEATKIYHKHAAISHRNGCDYALLHLGLK
jgi:hypothetical protein